MLAKRRPYRNRRLLDLAHRVNVCQFRLAPCIGYSVDGCEPAHSNHQEHGKGMGQKADDDQHVAACPACHRHYDGGKLGHNARQEFTEARERTFALYEKEGWLMEVGCR